jgi:hypothetical protein
METKMALPRGFPEKLYKKTLDREKTSQVCVRCGEPFREPEPQGQSSLLENRVSDLCSPCREHVIYLCLNRGLNPNNLQSRVGKSTHQNGGER